MILEATLVILSNVWTDSNLTLFIFGQLFMWIGADNYHILTSYELDERSWTMFELPPTWLNYTFMYFKLYVN